MVVEEENIRPDQDEWEYIGWIPCLAGELFFKYAVPELAEYDIFTLNYLGNRDGVTGEKSRYVIASSVYDWKDSGKHGETGVFRIVLIAHTGVVDCLQGSVFFITEDPIQSNLGTVVNSIFPQAEENLLCRLRELEDIVLKKENDVFLGDIQGNLKLIDELELAISSVPDDQADRQSIEKIISKIDIKHVHKVVFSVDNAGFTLLKYEGQKDPVSGKYDQPQLPSESPNAEWRLQTHRSTLCRQSFYYLKYLLHKHAHHDPSNDSLATTHRYKGKCVETARALIHDMKTGLVDIKRAARHERPNFAGIATYGKSLVTSCYAKGFFGVGDQALQAFRTNHDYFDNLSQSISLLNNKYAPKRERRRQQLTTIQQLLAIAFLFITPLILISRNFIEKSVEKDGVSTLFVNHFGEASVQGFILMVIERLGRGDLILLLKAYILLFFLAFLAHFLLVDKKTGFETSRAIFNFLRRRAFSTVRCRDTMLRSGIWYLHHPIVRSRRWLRGYQYKKSNMGPLIFLYAIGGCLFFVGVWIIARSFAYLL